MEITSRENPRVKQACALRDSEKQRAAAGLFFAEGPKLVLELAHGCALHTLFATEEALARTPALAAFADRTFRISAPVAEKLAGTRTPQGAFALFETPSADPAPLLASARRVLMLEAVQDPGNVGTLLRSAAAFGFDAVLLGPGCAAPFSPKVLRASMGAAGRLPLGVCRDLEGAIGELRARGVCCLAAAAACSGVHGVGPSTASTARASALRSRGEKAASGAGVCAPASPSAPSRSPAVQIASARWSRRSALVPALVGL